MKPFIYGLVDPLEPKHVRYVGMAFKPSRPRFHAWQAHKDRRTTHKLNWIRFIQAQGREPEFIVLEEFSEDVSKYLVREVEKMYIASLRQIGHDLTNATDGGEGVLGFQFTDEMRSRMSEAQRRRPPVSNETKQRLSKAGKGRPHTEEHRRKIQEALRIHWQQRVRVPLTDEQRRARSEALIGRKFSDETRRKISLARKGMHFSDEHLKHLREAKRRWFEQQQICKLKQRAGEDV